MSENARTAYSGLAGRWPTYHILVAITLAAGVLSAYLAPIEISAVTQDFGTSVHVAGLLVTGELVAVALSALLIIPFLRNSSARSFAVAGLLAAILCNLFSANAGSVVAFAILRVLAGTAYGILYGVSCFWSGQDSRGTRAFALGLLLGGTLVSFAMVFLPVAVLNFGLSGLYFPMAAVTALILIVLLAHREPPSIMNAARPHESAGWLDGGTFFPFALIVLISVLACGALQMIWSYSTSLAELHKFESGTTAAVLSTAALGSIIGSLLAAFISNRFGYVGPLIIASMLCAVATIGSGYFSSPLMFGVCIFITQLFGFALIPILVGAGIVFDAGGRASPIIGSSGLLGGAVTPMIGGGVYDWSSAETLVWTCGGIYAAAGICAAVLVPLMRARR